MSVRASRADAVAVRFPSSIGHFQVARAPNEGEVGAFLPHHAQRDAGRAVSSRDPACRKIMAVQVKTRFDYAASLHVCSYNNDAFGFFFADSVGASSADAVLVRVAASSRVFQIASAPD